MLFFIIFVIIWFVILMNMSISLNNNRQISLGVLGLILVYWGFSYINAPDMPSYIEFFHLLHTDGWVLDSLWGTSAYGMEPGLFLIMQFCKRINDSFYFFQFLMLSINVILSYVGLVRMYDSKKKALIFLLLYVFNITFFMSAMRQGVAISIMIFCLPLFADNKWKYYIPLVLLAIFFHQSALLLIAIPIFNLFFNKFKFSRCFFKNVFWVTFFICNVMYFSGISLDNIIESKLGSFVYDSSLSTSRAMSLEGNMDVSNFGVMKIIEINFAYIITFLLNKIIKNKYWNIIVGLFYIYFVINMLIGGIIVHRINYYLQIPYYMCLFSSLYYVLNNRLKMSRTMAFGTIYCYMAILYFIQAVASPDYLFEYNIIDVL